jgi:hypothetical protein
VTRAPRLGDPIELRDVRGEVYASRVEGLDDGRITAAEPLDLPAAGVDDRTGEWDVVWTEDTGVHCVPTRLDATSVDHHVRLWHLRVIGEGWTEQRRDYVRVPWSGRIVITPDGDVGDPYTATFVDLSEVAAQCLVELPRDDPRVAVGLAVSCAFAIADDDFVVDGGIIVVRPGGTSRQCRVVVKFAASRAQSDALRKNVFRIQLARRRGLQG